MCVQYEKVSFDVFKAMKYPSGAKECFRVDVLDEICAGQQARLSASEPLITTLTHTI